VSRVRPLLVCGTRSFAEEVADLAGDVPDLSVVGFVENLDRERTGVSLRGLPVLWVDDIPANHWAICALATTLRSRFTAEVESRGVPFATLVHPAAHVSSSTELAEGVIAGPGVVVAAHATIGRHVLLNRGVLVGHHTAIGAHSSLLPGANVAGNCRVGEQAFIGMGALVLDNLEVGAGAVVAAGSVVTRDVPPRAQVMGAPARVVPGREGPR
jgi:acetyltransferase EpsM